MFVTKHIERPGRGLSLSKVEDVTETVGSLNASNKSIMDSMTSGN